ncbi:hypothetical protein Nepgr_003875 [Nepenthes gracilis]|uniref:Uncharacterized protein n=1 Tax=Nepenthes gracilis TaxID=150966 RepID=A0AAD3S0B7_NEPGR|nr:hypothetical protein Nepgr_003875 [Nepenthes gracilis]
MDDWQADKVGLTLRISYGCFGRIGRYEFLDWMPGLHRISSLHLSVDLANLTGYFLSSPGCSTVPPFLLENVLFRPLPWSATTSSFASCDPFCSVRHCPAQNLLYAADLECGQFQVIAICRFLVVDMFVIENGCFLVMLLICWVSKALLLRSGAVVGMQLRAEFENDGSALLMDATGNAESGSWSLDDAAGQQLLKMAVGAAVLVLQEVNWLFWPTVLLRWKIMHGWAADMDEASAGVADCVSAASRMLIFSNSGVWPFC